MLLCNQEATKAIPHCARTKPLWQLNDKRDTIQTDSIRGLLKLNAKKRTHSIPVCSLTQSDPVGPLDALRHQDLPVHPIHTSLLDLGSGAPVGPVHESVGWHRSRSESWSTEVERCKYTLSSRPSFSSEKSHWPKGFACLTWPVQNWCHVVQLQFVLFKKINHFTFSLFLFVVLSRVCALPFPYHNCAFLLSVQLFWDGSCTMGSRWSEALSNGAVAIRASANVTATELQRKHGRWNAAAAHSPPV